jgi:hypothetical protein
MTRTILQIDGLLALDECEDLIRKAEMQGFSRARLQQAGRLNDESFVEYLALAETLKLRVADHVPMAEVDDLIEIYRYGRGDEIQTHADMGRRIRNGLRSNATLLIYLSISFCGGHTIFTDTNQTIVPAIGRAVVFSHHLPHRAEPVLSGTKYVARLDIVLRQP